MQYALWVAEPLLTVAIATLMYRKRMHRRFPLFFSFQIFHFVYWCLTFAASFAHYSTYFYTFWTLEPFVILFTFANIHELFGAMFQQREGLKDFGTMLFRWAIIVMVLMGLVLATTNSNFDRAHFISVLVSLERSVQLMMIGLLLFLFSFSSHLGITPKHKVFGLITGWGVNYSLELLLYTERARAAFSNQTFNILHLLIYNVMLLVWLGYVLVPEPREVLPNMLLRSQRWNEALRENQAADEAPLLIGIESLVERALSEAEK